MTLHETATMNYPIGTKFIACNTNIVCEITTGLFSNDTLSINEFIVMEKNVCTDYIYHCIYDKSWAKIVYSPSKDCSFLIKVFKKYKIR